MRDLEPVYVIRPALSGAISSEAAGYVGATHESLRTRLGQHIKESVDGRKSKRCVWIRSLSQKPTIEALEWVLPELRDEREKYWIALFRDYGHVLYNSTDGGMGLLGYEHTKATREKIGKAHTGLTRSLEARQNMSESHKGAFVSPAHRAALSAATKGIPRPDIAILQTGRKRKNSTSRFHGVCWDAHCKKWRAQISCGKIHLGRFYQEEDAARAVDKYVLTNNLPNPLNFP